MLTSWIKQDSTTFEEQRAALVQLVERIEFDPATGVGYLHYRIGASGKRFELDAAAQNLGLSKARYNRIPRAFASSKGPTLASPYWVLV